jgi:hypothetical protein
MYSFKMSCPCEVPFERVVVSVNRSDIGPSANQAPDEIAAFTLIAMNTGL